MREIQVDPDHLRYEMVRAMRQQLANEAMRQENIFRAAMRDQGIDLDKATFTWLVSARNDDTGVGTLDVQVVPWLGGRGWPTSTKIHLQCELLAGFDPRKARKGVLFDPSALHKEKRSKPKGFKS